MNDLFEWSASNTFSTDLFGRVRSMNSVPLRADRAQYVLCWVQQTLRAHDNPLLDAAIALGDQLGLPVVVYHGLRQGYPHASDRLHRFIVGGARDLQKGCRARGLRAVTYVERPGFEEEGLVLRLAASAAAVLTDDQPVFVARWQTQRFSLKCPCPYYAVDTTRLVPSRVLPAGLSTTPAFRAASTALRPVYEAHASDFETRQKPFDGDLCFDDHDLCQMSDSALDALVASCQIDHTLPHQKAFEPTAMGASMALDTLIGNGIATYAYRRNTPSDESGVSRLSPYLHFGFLGPRQIVKAVKSSGVARGAQWKFLDELLTWREWFHYLADRSATPEAFENIPASARKTLMVHATDLRPHLYNLADLLHGRTEDETWNAAQRQWLTEGYMHNNLRMYWGKKLIEWTPDTQAAWITACYINDRLSLDGRDAATYGNMQWCFGRAKPGYSERPVYGWVAPKSDSALRKRKGVPEWLAQKASMSTPSVSVPKRAFINTSLLARLEA